MADQQDSWDAMRGRAWDMYKGDGSPEDSLDALLGVLGAARKTVAEQQMALQGWLDSAPANAAPGTLVSAVHKFLEVPARDE